jgi:hypothetical protein
LLDVTWVLAYSLSLTEIRGAKKAPKVKNKITRVLLEESFEDILINVGVDVSYEKCKVEVKASNSTKPFNCEPDQKILDVLEFDKNFKIIDT